MSWYSNFKLAKVNGYDMLVDPQDNNISDLLFNGAVWEPPVTDYIQKHFKFGTFVDCGAHIGYFTLLAARTAYQVYAFEMSPMSFRYLTLNTFINHLTNVAAYPLALWDVDGVEVGSPDAMGNYHDAQGAVVRTLTNTGNNGVLVPYSGRAIQSVTLDSVLGGVKIDMIKIDCEQSDKQVLHGAKRILTEQSPKILVESPDAEFLSSLGYQQTADLSSGHGPTFLWERN